MRGGMERRLRFCGEGGPAAAAACVGGVGRVGGIDKIYMRAKTRVKRKNVCVYLLCCVFKSPAGPKPKNTFTGYSLSITLTRVCESSIISDEPKRRW